MDIIQLGLCCLYTTQFEILIFHMYFLMEEGIDKVLWPI